MKFKSLKSKSMVMNAFVGLMLLSAAATSSRAEIHEIRSMTEILPYIDEQTLLVFDLDNTVIEPVQTLGSDQWFQSLLKQAYTVDQAVSLWSQVQPLSQMKAVEAITPEIILSDQLVGLKVMALTARPANLAQVTENQLLSIGVSFLGSPVYGDDVADMNGQGAQGPQYIHGIEFVGPTSSKGEALVQFLHHINFKPGRIVFVDDTAKHTITVNDSLTSEGIENFEFRYGALDAQVAAFDSKVAEIELRVFQNCGNIISDDDALRLENQAENQVENQSPNSSYWCQ